MNEHVRPEDVFIDFDAFLPKASRFRAAIEVTSPVIGMAALVVLSGIVLGG